MYYIDARMLCSGGYLRLFPQSLLFHSICRPSAAGAAITIPIIDLRQLDPSPDPSPEMNL